MLASSPSFVAVLTGQLVKLARTQAREFQQSAPLRSEASREAFYRKWHKRSMWLRWLRRKQWNSSANNNNNNNNSAHRPIRIFREISSLPPLLPLLPRTNKPHAPTLSDSLVRISFAPLSWLDASVWADGEEWLREMHAVSFVSIPSVAWLRDDFSILFSFVACVFLLLALLIFAASPLALTFFQAWKLANLALRRLRALPLRASFASASAQPTMRISTEAYCAVWLIFPFDLCQLLVRSWIDQTLVLFCVDLRLNSSYISSYRSCFPQNHICNVSSCNAAGRETWQILEIIAKVTNLAKDIGLLLYPILIVVN
jgi:hypothetical protein